jgi:hypothetical protein
LIVVLYHFNPLSVSRSGFSENYRVGKFSIKKIPAKPGSINLFAEQKFLQIESTFLFVMLIALAVPFGSRTR